MISESLFKSIIKSQLHFEERIREFSESISGEAYGLYDSDWFNSELDVFDGFLKSNFNDEGVDLIYWWMYDDVEKIISINVERTLFTDSKVKKISVETLDELWNFINNYKEDYINE